MTAPDPPPTPDAAPRRGGRRPDLDQLHSGFGAAANVIARLRDHISELDTADLPVVDGQTVRIVSLAEVEEWLTGLETRVRNGTIL